MEVFHPKVSIIVPVFHEEDAINPLLDHLETLDLYSCEVLVVDGDPDGNTLAQIGARPNLELKLLHSAKGRATQMNQGALSARGNWFLFLHADTLLPCNPVPLLEKLDPAVQAGAFRLGFDSSRFRCRLIAFFANLRAQWLGMYFGDQALFLRSTLFQELKGYSILPVLEDLDLIRRVTNRGHQVTFLNHTVRTSFRRWDAEGWIRCTLRNWVMLALFYAGVPAGRLKHFYPSARKSRIRGRA